MGCPEGDKQGDKMTTTLEELYRKFKKEYLPEPVKPVEKPRKSKYATEEERKEAMRQNGIRLAAANKARREPEN